LAFDWLSIGFAKAPIIVFTHTIGFDLSIFVFWLGTAFAAPSAGPTSTGRMAIVRY
jgi:hypothetical protein